MKTRAFLALLIAIAILSVGCSTPVCNNESRYVLGNSMGQMGQADFILNVSLPDTPENLNFYKIVPPNITDESVTSLGNKLGFTGEASPIPPDMIGISTLNERLWVSDIGHIDYSIGHSLFGLAVNLPSNEEAAQIAINFLKEIGLWFSDIELKEVKVGGTVNTEPSHLLVQFTQRVNGIPLTGPSKEFGIRIGDGGKVVRAEIWHPELEFQGEVRCIDSAQACDRLLTGRGLFGIPSDCREVKINDIYIGYYLDSHIDKEEIVMPVYVFEGECLDPTGKFIQDFIAWIEAESKLGN